MEIYTIGFTKKSAAQFFETLRLSGIRRLIDVRLNNTSQLAAFAKRDDLAYFLAEICGADYRHCPKLSPTKEILDAYKARTMPWDEYEEPFVALLTERRVGRSSCGTDVGRGLASLGCFRPSRTRRLWRRGTWTYGDFGDTGRKRRQFPMKRWTAR